MAARPRRILHQPTTSPDNHDEISPRTRRAARHVEIVDQEEDSHESVIRPRRSTRSAHSESNPSESEGTHDDSREISRSRRSTRSTTDEHSDQETDVRHPRRSTRETRAEDSQAARRSTRSTQAKSNPEPDSAEEVEEDAHVAQRRTRSSIHAHAPSDDESPKPTGRSLRTRQRGIPADDSAEEDDEEDDREARRSRSRLRPRRTRASSHDSEDDDQEQPRAGKLRKVDAGGNRHSSRIQRSHFRQDAEPSGDESEDDEDDPEQGHFVRRSSRPRTLKYSSFNATHMMNQVVETPDAGAPQHTTRAEKSVDRSQDSSEEESEEESHGRRYSLRERPDKPKVPTPMNLGSFGRRTLGHSSFSSRSAARSSNRRSGRDGHRRRLHFSGGTSTTEEEWSSQDDDERQFSRRKDRSMMLARRTMLPMNFPKEGGEKVLLKDRERVGGSLADIEPMQIDRTTSFDDVGGLQQHVHSLKEMIVFPLVYPEVFQKFSIQPPRGVLFHGPPGTGKTLLARALANECSKAGRTVSFFMRKGADCLSKWIGESERMLRLLFDQAYVMRPSIIFFDEIDGLAPVRSSRQDQIYSSIVSTLLALMDGLDSRSEVVVIGATNRLDSIDPALRRPGRFDREFAFKLPSQEARKAILKIHTAKWKPALSDSLIDDLADKCAGYCGADLKSLCTEAVLLSLRRVFPQIYDAADKVQLDTSRLHVTAADFTNGIRNITPAAQRAVTNPAKALPTDLRPLLQSQLRIALERLAYLLPSAVATRHQIHRLHAARGTGSTVASPDPHYPRLLLAGKGQLGQTTHVAPALLNELEQYPVFTLSLAALFADSAVRSCEEACVQIVKESRRSTPCIIFMPCVDAWWFQVSAAVQALIVGLLKDLPAQKEILVLMTSECEQSDLPHDLAQLFDIQTGVVTATRPTDEDRRNFFKILFEEIRAPLVAETQAPLPSDDAPPEADETSPRITRQSTRKSVFGDLSLKPRVLSEAETRQLEQREHAVFRELRMYLRTCIDTLMRERKFHSFLNEEGYEHIEDYLDIVKTPMNLQLVLDRVNQGLYVTVDKFLEDIELICHNAVLYNPPSGVGLTIRNRAADLRDHAAHLIDNARREHGRLLKECEEISEARLLRSKPDQQPAVPAALQGSEIPSQESESVDAGPDEQEVGDAAPTQSESDSPQEAHETSSAESNGVSEQADGSEHQLQQCDEPQEVQCDEGQLDNMLSALVLATSSADLVELQRILWKARMLIFEHRKEVDKAALIQRIAELASHEEE
eukprot:m.506263 g.506263  ORF g.506263 m.506263 type:complete len:1270 (+) comp57372_c0_seq7:108-3917(+)